MLSVQHGPEAQCGVGMHNLELGDHLLEHLSREEREGILGQTDLLVGMPELHLGGEEVGREEAEE